MDAQEYVRIITEDDRELIVRETPVVYTDDHLEREYEFHDGAVVKYEWQDSSLRGFNHRFTLVSVPRDNPKKLIPGEISRIDY